MLIQIMTELSWLQEAVATEQKAGQLCEIAQLGPYNISRSETEQKESQRISKNNQLSSIGGSNV